VSVPMRVAYVSVFRFETDQGRYGRMHDVFEGFRNCNVDFEQRVFSLIDESDELALSRFGMDIDDLWGSRIHNLQSLVSGPRTRRRIVSYDPDVIHVLTARPVEGLVARTVAEQLGIPVICGPNIGGWFPIRPVEYWEKTVRETAANRLNYLANRWSVAMVAPDVLLAFSDYHRSMLESVRGDGAIEVLRPAVHPRFSPDPGVTRDIDLLYVGDVSRRKGYPVLVDVLERLDGDRPLRVDVVGGTPEQLPQFERINVRARGFVPRTDLLELYNRH